MPEPPPHRDDNLMERFDREGARRFGARQAVLSIAITAFVLVLCAGASIRKAGEEMSPGIGRDVVLAVGRPSAWMSDQLPLHSLAHTLTAWLSPDANLPRAGSFANLSTSSPIAGGVPPVTSDAFDPGDLGLARRPTRTLRTLLVTGDSMSQGLDLDLAQAVAPLGIRAVRDPRPGTGISKPILVDWGRLSTHQVSVYHPDAVVVFIGANEGFSMPDAQGHQVQCCSVAWAAIYANRVRQMMNTYRQNGAAVVYWLTLPAPREAERAVIARAVNAAIEVAAEPWRSDVRAVDTVPIFTPGFVYRDSMRIGGQPTLVRQSDGIHLNDAGAALAAKVVLGAMAQDFRGLHGTSS
jgi:lysophospholipase L1-like esterase